MADAIWNDRYILSNMTSEKLYAKSPLTTGVSGTSAYIGLEPSATYNETLLCSATIQTGASPTAYHLSEPISAFESYKVYWLWNQGTDSAPTVTEFFWSPDIPNNRNFTLFSVNRYAGTNYSAWGLFELASNLQDITYTFSQQNGDTANKYIKISKIIGINRKEV